MLIFYNARINGFSICLANFFIAGVLIKGKSYQFRSYIVIAISNLLVFSYAEHSTSILLVFLSLLVYQAHML